MKFNEIPYQRPDLTSVQSTYQKIAKDIESATNAASVIDAVQVWNTERIRVGTAGSLAEVHFTQNVTDEVAKTEKLFFDQNSPTVAEYDMDVASKILASPFVDDVSAKFGPLFLRRLSDSMKSFDPAIKELLVEESNLCRRYNEITASAKLTVDGETYNLSTISRLIIDLDPGVRERAVRATHKFLLENADELDSLFDQLVAIRHKKAKQLGYANYIEYRYVEFGRVDYDQKDVETFRGHVIDYVVPVVQKLRDAQANRLGMVALSLADEKLQFSDGNPVAEGDHDWIVARAEQMYSELSPETNEFFNLMLSNNLLDLKSRDNKATGGYCTSFSEHGLPFIFANFNRTTHDIEVLTHEAGHAFQAYRSRKHIVPEYFWPTAEACEIHSMGMEFLTWPWMHNFFGQQIDKFKFYHLQGALLFLPYGCLVDHFQHWVYANPTATSKERNSMWVELEGLYLPWRESDGFAAAEQGRVWQFQRHIYESPFYYIDYALAQTCALQYWKWSQTDRASAFASYLKICDIGGSKPFLEIVEAGGLRSPFDPNCLADVVKTVETWLDEQYPQYLQM